MQQDRPQRHGRLIWALLAWLGTVGILALAAPGPAQAQPQYTISPPPGWIDKRDQPDGLLRQIIEPGENAMVEIYYTEGVMDSLDDFANQAEQGIRELGMPYVARRTSSQVFTKHGTRSIGRTYSGRYEGTPVESSIHYLAYDGFSLVVLGVYPRDYPQYKNAVLATLETFRVGPAPAATSGGTGGGSSVFDLGGSPAQKKATSVFDLGSPGAAQGTAPGVATTETGSPGLTAPAPVSSSVSDPVALLPPDTALDKVLAGRIWEVDAFPLKAEQHSLDSRAPYRVALASYVPVGETSPEVDISIYTGGADTLRTLLTRQLAGAPGHAGGNGAWAGELDGRAAIWVLAAKGLYLVTAPDHELASQAATIAVEHR